MKHRWLVLFALCLLGGIALVPGRSSPAAAHVFSPAWFSILAAPAAVPAYTITDLGDLGGGYSTAWAINAAGQIVGDSTFTTPANTRWPHHAFFWEKGQMHDLGALASYNSYAYAINAAGQVVGQADIDDDSGNDAALWQNGTTATLGDLGGYQSEAHGINAKGQVVGWSKTDSSQLHAFLWENGGMTDLGTLGGDQSIAEAINDAGQVAGESDLAGAHARSHAFLWENGQMRDLGPPGAAGSGAHGINRAGVACGDANGQACVWENGVFKKLGSPGHAWSINATGQTVGQMGTGGAGLWENGQVIDLQNWLPAGSGWKLQIALGINDAGQIVGYGSHNGKSHGFLMSPQ